MRKLFVFAMSLPVFIALSAGCSSANDESTDPEEESAETGEAVSGLKDLICNGACTAAPTLACMDFGLEVGAFCAVGSEAACLGICTKRAPYRPSAHVAQLCLEKLHLSSPHCAPANRFQQHCSVQIGHQSGGAAVQYGAAGPSAGKIFVSYKVGNHVRPLSVTGC